MKLVPEHIFEKFTEESDPIHDMGIGEIHQIQKTISGIDITKMTPNEMLITGVNYNHTQLIKYAIKKGADQLWWQSGGPFGGYHGLTSNLVNELVKIVGTRGDSIVFDDALRYFHDVKKFKNPKSIYKSTSRIFTSKFSPVDDYFVKRIQDVKDKSTALLKIINEYKK